MHCGAGNSVEPHPNIEVVCHGCIGARTVGACHEHAGPCHGGGDHALVTTPHALQTDSQDVLRLYHVLIGLENGNTVADVGYSCVPGRSVGGS